MKRANKGGHPRARPRAPDTPQPAATAPSAVSELEGPVTLKARDQLSHEEALAYWSERAAAKEKLAAIEALPPPTTLEDHLERTAEVKNLTDELVRLDRPSALPGDSPAEGPAALPTPTLAHLFQGLNGWNEAGWKKRLGDRDKWLPQPVYSGRRGRHAAHWDPVAVAMALMTFASKRGTSPERLARFIRARFQREILLKPWFERWKDEEAEHFGENQAD